MLLIVFFSVQALLLKNPRLLLTKYLVWYILSFRPLFDRLSRKFVFTSQNANS